MTSPPERSFLSPLEDDEVRYGQVTSGQMFSSDHITYGSPGPTVGSNSVSPSQVSSSQPQSSSPTAEAPKAPDNHPTRSTSTSNLTLFRHACDLFQVNAYSQSLKAHRSLVKQLPPASTSTDSNVLQASPKYINPAYIHVNIAIIRLHLGEYALACESLDTALSYQPRLAISWYLLGLSLYQLGSFKRAQRRFMRCLGCFTPPSRTNPDGLPPLVNITTGGSETEGAETGGVETEGAETGGVETGGAETGRDHEHALQVPDNVEVPRFEVESFDYRSEGLQFMLRKIRVEWNIRLCFLWATWKSMHGERPKGWCLNRLPGGLIFEPRPPPPADEGRERSSSNESSVRPRVQWMEDAINTDDQGEYDEEEALTPARGRAQTFPGDRPAPSRLANLFSRKQRASPVRDQYNRQHRRGGSGSSSGSGTSRSTLYRYGHLQARPDHRSPSQQSIRSMHSSPLTQPAHLSVLDECLALDNYDDDDDDEQKGNPPIPTASSNILARFRFPTPSSAPSTMRHATPPSTSAVFTSREVSPLVAQSHPTTITRGFAATRTQASIRGDKVSEPFHHHHSSPIFPFPYHSPSTVRHPLTSLAEKPLPPLPDSPLTTLARHPAQSIEKRLRATTLAQPETPPPPPPPKQSHHLYKPDTPVRPPPAKPAEVEDTASEDTDHNQVRDSFGIFEMGGRFVPGGSQPQGRK